MGVLLASGLLKDAPPVVPKPKLGLVGVLLSVAGLGLLVLGILQSTSRGWRDPLVLTMIAIGLVVIGIFVWWIRRRERLGEPVLVHPSIFRHKSIWAGLPVLSTQTFAQAGLLFLVPLFAQSFLGLDAFETGLTLLPLSIAVLLTSISTPRLGRRIYPKYIIQFGLFVLFLGGFLLSEALGDADSGGDLWLGLVVAGVGLGLVVGQLPNMILSGVDAEEASEASGLQGTAQNLGMALGTAVVGSVILTTATLSFGTQVTDSSVFSEETKAAVENTLTRQLETAGVEGIEEAFSAEPPEVQEEAARLFEDSAVHGFQAAIIAGGIVALLGMLLAIKLPKQRLGEEDGIVEETVRNKTIPAMQLEMQDL